MMMKRILSALLFGMVLPFFCFSQSDSLRFVQTGLATQEIEADEFIAGHAILPIGQDVTITNLDNGAEISVTISKRIPQNSARIIDISTGAAASLAMFDASTQVTIEAQLKPSAPAPAAPQAADPAIAPAAAAPGPVAPQAPAPTIAAVPAPAAPVTAQVPAPVFAAPAAIPEETSTPLQSEVTVIPPTAPAGPVPISEIEPIVPPWEIGTSVPWPAQSAWPVQSAQSAWPVQPELSRDPWITAPNPKLKPRETESRSAPPPEAPAPVRTGPAAKIVPAMPGPGSASQLFRVQIGAFKAQQNAKDAFDRLLSGGFHPAFEQQGTLIKVSIPWVRGYELPDLAQRLYSLGFREAWIRKE